MAIVTHGGTLPDLSQKTDFYAIVDQSSVTNIVNADISATAAIAGSKLGTLNTITAGAGVIPAANIPSTTTPPATNSADYVPQWDGANSKTLKNGLAVGTSASNLVQLDGSAHLPAVDGSALTGIVTDRKQLFTSTGTFTPGTGITTVYITAIAGGGGGKIGSNGKCVGGGGSGAYLIKCPVTVVPSTGYTMTVPTAAASGSNGGSTVINFEGGSYTLLGGGSGSNSETGGLGGLGLAVYGSPSNPGIGGQVGTASPGGDNKGAPGAGSPFGQGGPGVARGAAGSTGNAIGYGSGGGGSDDGAGSEGGVGGPGFILVEW